MKSNRENAKRYHNLGLNVVPIRTPGEKYTDGRTKRDRRAVGKEPRVPWKQYQFRPQTESQVDKLFPPDRDNNIAVIGGVASRNLVALDFDDLDRLIDLQRKNSFFRWLYNNTLTDRTRRGSHVFVRADRPAKSGKNPELNMDVKAQGGYVLAPDSVWKHGQIQGRYLFDTWNEIVQVSLDQLRFLGVTPADFADADWLGLGYKHYSILQGKHDGYKSRSEAEFALVVKLVANGEDFPYVAELFRRFAGDDTHYRNHTNPEGYLWTCYQNAVAYYAENARDFDKKVAQAMHAATGIEYRTHTDRAAMLAILQKAREAGKSYLTISRRELAEIANFSQQTATNALHRLQNAGLIERKYKGDDNTPAGFKLDFDAIGKVSHTNAFAISKLSHTNTVSGGYGMANFGNKNPARDFQADSYAWGALGKTGYQVVQFLNAHVLEWCTVADIQAGANLGYNTVRRKLVELGRLVESRKQGRTTQYRAPREITVEDVAFIARRTGIAGRGARRKLEHKAERTAYRNYKARKRDPFDLSAG